MPASIWQSALVSASEMALLVTPRRRPATLKPPVIFCPSAGGAASLFLNGADATYGPRSALVRRVADMGHVCLAGDFGGANTFGNATVIARLLTAWTFLQTQPLAATGPVILFGASMGGVSALNFARTYGTAKVKGIVSAFGVTDLDDIYQNDRGGFRATIGTAHGVTYPAALPATANPATNTSELGSIPWRGWYASDDTLVVPATQTAFAAAVANGIATSVGAQGHDDDVITAAWDSMLSTISALAA